MSYPPAPNPYDPPPGNPYGPPPAQGGHPPAPGQPQPGYGYAPIGPPPVYPRAADGTPISPWGPCAALPERFIALLWDVVYQWPAVVAGIVAVVAFSVGSALVGTDASTPLIVVGVILYVVSLGLSLWRAIANLYLRQGRTGQSWGKAKRNIQLIREIDGQPAGALICFVRYLLGGVINNVVYLDALWTLWDPKRQRLSDKILGLIVVNAASPSRSELR